MPEQVSDKPIDQDWINHFFSSVQDISTADLQKLWGKILARETASPGTYSRRFVDFMRTVEKFEAEMIAALLPVCFTTEEGWYFYFSQSAVTYEVVRSKLGTTDWTGHLIDIGVLSSQEGMPPSSSLTGREVSFGKIRFVLNGPPPPEPPQAGRLSMIEHWVEVRNFTALFADTDRAFLDLTDWEFSADRERKVQTLLTRFDAIFTLNQDVFPSDRTMASASGAHQR